MKLTHLGDALDHWKGSLIRLLKRGKVLRNLRILPMITDTNAKRIWSDPCFELYARLLSVNESEILKPKIELLDHERRSEYFSIGSNYDLFIDPDIGIENTKPRKEEKFQREKYILLSEVAGLLRQDSSRLILIFQYSSNGKDWLKKKTNDLKNYLSKCDESRSVFAYFAGQTSMMFMSQDSQRVKNACNCLEEFLGPLSICRLIRPEMGEENSTDSLQRQTIIDGVNNVTADGHL
jgi:hypothetical protein